MKEMAQEALDIQDACNLSGVVHAWSRLLPDLREQLDRLLGNRFNTQKLNMHPINVLFSDKIASLTYSDGGIVFSQSYDECHKLAKGVHIGSEFYLPKKDDE